jgi:predicted HAD superfamily Cof-like phosphohydrolase
MIIEEICNWNKDRGLTEFDGALEFEMLAEELQEFVQAGAKTLQDKFGKLSEEEVHERAEEIQQYAHSFEGQLEHDVNMADALGDIIFVAIGSLYKLTGDYQKVHNILLAITAANNMKTNDTNDSGKIVKPDGFVGPEETIKRIISGK